MKEALKRKSYKSPPRKLVTFFEKSRDRWKAKCRDAKIEVKRLKNRVRFLEKSKEHWKSRVKELEAELAMVKAKEREKEEEFEQLKKRLPKNQWSQEALKRLISFLTITSTLSDMSRCLCHWCYQQRQVFDVQVEPSRQSYGLYNFRYLPHPGFPVVSGCSGWDITNSRDRKSGQTIGCGLSITQSNSVLRSVW